MSPAFFFSERTQPRDIGGQPFQAHDGEERLPDTTHGHLCQIDQGIVIQMLTSVLTTEMFRKLCETVSEAAVGSWRSRG